MADLQLLLCSDLDRTLIPNGAQPESPGARDRLRALAARDDVQLAYVSGRHRALIEEAIETWSLPLPDYAIGDVGTTIYRVAEDGWSPLPGWQAQIAPDWQGRDGAALAGLLEGIDGLTLQEAEKQNRFKLSYYAALSGDSTALLAEVARRLAQHGIRAKSIWSIDEEKGVGLLDVLPASADKLAAIRYLMAELGADEQQTLFSGDSGNDLEPLTSGLQAVLVANAAPEVREAALAGAAQPQRLYLATGGFLGMNGHYSAGVLEGVAHFMPALGRWLADG